MTDTYAAIAAAAASQSLRSRVAACAAQQGVTEPESWAYRTCWAWAAAPGWGAAWASAQAAGSPDPGADEAVISDAMVLSQTQALLGTTGT